MRLGTRGRELEEMRRKAVIEDLGGARIFAWERVETEYRNLCITNFTVRKIALMLALIKLGYMFVPLS